MADTVYETGKNRLFSSGWTSSITWARLYTSSDVLVDQRSVTFTYVSDHIEPTDDIIFQISTATSNVSYVVIGFTSGLDAALYRKDLSELYDFSGSGTLTVDLFTIGLTGASLTTAGREALFTTGWNGYVVNSKIKNAGGDVDTTTCSFSVDGNNDFSLNSQIVFDVPAGTNGVNVAQLLDSSNVPYWSRVLSTSYNFATKGEFRINTWVITI